MGEVLQGAKSRNYIKTDIPGIENSGDTLDYVSVQESPGKRGSLDTVIHGSFTVSSGHAVEVGSVKRLIKSTAHGAKKGWIMRPSDGLAKGEEISILKIEDSNTFVISEIFDLSIGDSFDICRMITPNYTETGDLNVVVTATNAPVQYLKDAVVTTVSEDTAVPTDSNTLPSKMFIEVDGLTYPVRKDTTVPANTVSVPVEITGASGPINITAGDLNVQLSDQGPNADVTRIGNGTNQWGINAATEGLVHDADLLAAVQASSSTKTMSEFLYFDYTGVSDAGYTELVASTLDTIKAFTWFESSGQPMVVALGAIGLEVDKFVIPPGGFNGEISMDIPSGSRISIKQLNAEVLGSGIMIVANFLK